MKVTRSTGVTAAALSLAAACAVTAASVLGERAQGLLAAAPAAAGAGTDAIAGASADDPRAELEVALAICLRGNDPALTGTLDADFSDLQGNPLVATELEPACGLVAQAHPDAPARAAASVVMARAQEANGQDGGWWLRRAEAIAPEAAPVRLLRLRLDLAAAEADPAPFRDLTPLRERLAALGGLAAGSGQDLAARIDSAEVSGVWHDRGLVALAALGRQPDPALSDVERASFLQGIDAACGPYGQRATLQQSLGVGLARLQGLLKGDVLLLKEPYDDGLQFGKTLNCSGAELSRAYARVAEPLERQGQQAVAAMNDAFRSRP